MSYKKILLTQWGTFLILLLLKLSLIFLLSACGIGKKTETLLNGDKTTNKQSSNVKVDSLRYYYPVALANENKQSAPADTSMLSTLSGSLLFAREPAVYTFNKEH